MAQQVAVDVGETANMPWEARAWVTLLHAGKVTISFRDEVARGMEFVSPFILSMISVLPGCTRSPLGDSR